MALIAMAVYCTEENKKDQCLEQVLKILACDMLNPRHRFFFCVNGETKATREMLNEIASEFRNVDVVYNHENLGTAKAINLAWSFRQPGEHCVKMDDDILIAASEWIETMEEAIKRDPKIGQVGLKRKDCWETPWHESSDFKSELKMLPHEPGESWIVVEKVKHVIGSCVMHSSALLDKVGYLYQPGLYGYDDVIMSHRTHLAGFYSCFLPHIQIDHIDDGKTPYQDWKQKHSGEQTQTVIDLVHEMYAGRKSIYYGI